MAIGLAWWSEGVLTVKPAHALGLFRVTSQIVQSRHASLVQVQQIIGLRTHALLLRRPTFSTLYHTFHFLEETGVSTQARRRIQDSVLEELGALLDVFPLLSSDLKLQLSTPIYFSDACKSGAGVQYSDHSPREARLFKDNIAETRARKCWHPPLVGSLPNDDGELSYTSASPAVLRRPLKFRNGLSARSNG